MGNLIKSSARACSSSELMRSQFIPSDSVASLSTRVDTAIPNDASSRQIPNAKTPVADNAVPPDTPPVNPEPVAVPNESQNASTESNASQPRNKSDVERASPENLRSQANPIDGTEVPVPDLSDEELVRDALICVDQEPDEYHVQELNLGWKVEFDIDEHMMNHSISKC